MDGKLKRMLNNMDSSLDILELDELIVLAKLDLEANNLSGALIKLKHAHIKYCEDEVLVMLARLYARLGLFDKATPLFSEYLSNNPDAVVEKFQLGMTHFDNDQFDQALEVFEAIIDKEESNHPPAMFYSTLILTKQNKQDDAVSRLVNILSTVDNKNLFYSRAYEQLKTLDADKASQFSPSDITSPSQENKQLLN